MLTIYRPNGKLTRRHSGSFGGLFDDFFSPWESRGMAHHEPSLAVDLREEDGAYLIEADLPGFEEKDIDVTLESDELTIRASRESQQNEERNGFKLRERYHGSFQRSFRLGEKVSRDDIEASYRNGVLTVVLKKAPEAAPKQIPVAVN